MADLNKMQKPAVSFTAGDTFTNFSIAINVTDGIAPADILKDEFHFDRSGDIMKFFFYIQYDTAGTNNSQANFELPGDDDNEIIPSFCKGEATNRVIYQGQCMLIDSIDGSPVAATCYLYKDNTEKYYIYISSSITVNIKVITGQITYNIEE